MTEGYKSEAEGYAASLRQQAKWVRECKLDGTIDADEFDAAADFIERLPQSEVLTAEAHTADDLAHIEVWYRGFKAGARWGKRDAAQAVPDPDKTAKEIVSKWIGDCGGYLDLTFIQSELLQERIREYLPPSSLPSAEPCAFCGSAYAHCLTASSATYCRTSSVASAHQNTPKPEGN